MISDSRTQFKLPVVDPLFESGVRVQILHESDIDPRSLAAWEDLERHAVSSTPFLCRSFVKSAIDAKLGQQEPIYIVIEQENRWIGLGVFESVAATRTVPVAHLRSWRTNHTFLDGMLIRAGKDQLALNAFWNFMKTKHHSWYAVEFKQLAQDDFTSKKIEASATEAGVEFIKGPNSSRASIEFPLDNPDRSNGISKRRARSLRQGWNWLSKQGKVSFDLQRNHKKLRQSTLRFLELEAMGWKSNMGTALASREAEKEFFIDLVDRFARQDRVFFLELSIDETVIASVVHFIAGDISYAFKLGWDPYFSRGCPGFQLKAQTLFHAQRLLPQLKMIDSCACPGSFIEHVWGRRREIAPQVFITSRFASIACSMLGGIKWIRDRSCQFLHISRGQHDANC